MLHLVDVLGQRGHGALLVQALEGLAQLLDEELVAPQIVTEQALDPQQGGRVGAALAGELLQALGHGVVDVDGLALLVDAVEVAEPRGHGEGEALEVVLARVPDLLSNRGHDELGQLAGPVEGQAGDLVHDGRVGEAVHQLLDVVVDADALDLGEQGAHLLVHHVVEELVEHGVLDHVVHVLEARQVGHVGHGGVGSVEQAQLVALELLDLVHVLDNLHAHLVERGAPVGEGVLDDPLHEGLRHDGPVVLDAEPRRQVRLVGLGRARGDAVHHAVGERAVLGDPVGHGRVTQLGEREKHVAGDGAVLLHVVARQHGEGLEAGVLAALEGGEQVAVGGLGRGEVALQVGDDVGVLGVQLVRVLVVVVAALGDGHGHDLGVRVGHLGDDGIDAVGGVEERVDAADDARPAAARRPLDGRVQAVLGHQGVAHAGVEWLQTNTADGPLTGVSRVGAQQVVDVDRQMGAVEAADTDVHDALLQALAAVGWDHRGLVALIAAVRGDLGQILVAQPERLGCGLGCHGCCS